MADTLRIASNLSTGLELVPRAIAELKNAMPQLHITVEIATQAQITDQLLSGECDIGVVSFVQTHHPAINLHPIGEGEVLCAMAPGHPLAAKARITPEMLRRPDLISFGHDTSHGKIVNELVGGEGQPMVPIAPTVDVRYAYVACSIAASGWGVAVVDDMAARHCEGNGLVLRPLAKPLRYTAYAMSSAERPLSSAGQAVVRLMVRHWELARRVQPRTAASRRRRSSAQGEA